MRTLLTVLAALQIGLLVGLFFMCIGGFGALPPVAGLLAGGASLCTFAAARRRAL